MKLMRLALLIGLASCAGPRPPPHAVVTPWGTARAASESRTGQVASVLQRVAPRVSRELDVPAPPLVEIWQLDSGFEGAIDARTMNDRIELGPEWDAAPEWIVAHEFAHWCMRHDPRARWSELPIIAQEGLAEVAAFRALPDMRKYAEREHRHSLRSLSEFDPSQGVFEIDARDWVAITDETLLRALYAIGFVLALRIGPEGLAELCARARAEGLAMVPGAWMQERADLVGATPSDLRAALEQELARTPMR